MNSYLKFLTSCVGAAAVAVTLVAAASAQPKHQMHRASAPVHQMSECTDPGAHLWCAPAPVHDNTPPPA
jgi:hypothetical protein